MKQLRSEYVYRILKTNMQSLKACNLNLLILKRKNLGKKKEKEKIREKPEILQPPSENKTKIIKIRIPKVASYFQKNYQNSYLII